MVRITRERIINRYNYSHALFEQCKECIYAGDISKYEEHAISAIRESIGSLEWMLKRYLRDTDQSKMLPEDRALLKQPSFDDLMNLMGRYADPALSKPEISLCYEYRELRNASEHGASIPPHKSLFEAIIFTRGFGINYLQIPEIELQEISPVEEIYTRSHINSNIIDDETRSKKKFEPIIEHSGNTIRISRPNVKIIAELPYAFGKFELQLQFSRVDLGDLTIHLQYGYFLGNLLMGLNTSINQRTRRFIRPVDNGLFEVELEQLIINISLEEAEDLCFCIDYIGNEYKKIISKAEDILKTRPYLVTYENDVSGMGFYLISVKKELWKLMLAFSHEFDYDRGKTEWHIFEAQGFYIRISKFPESRFYDSVFIYPKSNNSLLGEDYIHLVYVMPEWFLNSITRSFGEWHTQVSPDKIWDAKKTMDWIVDKFIPKVVDYYKVDKNIQEYEIYNSSISYSQNGFLDVLSASKPKDLFEYASDIQSWAHHYPINMESNLFRRFLLSVAILAKEADENTLNIGYVIAKMATLYRLRTKDHDYLYGTNWSINEVLHNYRQEINIATRDTYMSSSDADLLMRICGTLLNAEYTQFQEIHFDVVKQTILPLIERCNFEQRYVIPHWKWNGLWFEA